MKHFRRLAAAALLFGVNLSGASPVARACPDCTLGRVARAQVWSHDFLFNAAVSLTPFLLVVAVSVWADRIGRPRS
jgi:hypothetical protein